MHLGPGLQKTLGFDPSWVFVYVSGSLSAAFVAMCPRRTWRSLFPAAFTLFVAYVFCHTAVTYWLFVHEDVWFGYLGETAKVDGIVVMTEAVGTKLARLALFVTFAYR